MRKRVRTFLAGSAAVLAVFRSVEAQVATYWSGDQGGVWSTNNAGNTNWSSASSVNTEAGTLPGSGNTAVFAITPTTITAASPRATNLNTLLGTDFSLAGLQFVSASGFGPTAVDIGAASGTARTLTLGSGGITAASGSGPVGFLAGVTESLAANQTWANNSANTLAFAGPVIAGTNTLTLAGTGPISISGAFSNAGAATVVKTGSGTLTLSGNNAGWAGTGGLTITGGSVVADYSLSTASKFVGPLTLGSASLTLQGNGANIVTQNAGGLALTGGGTITVAAPTAAINLNLGAISRPAQAVGANTYVIGAANFVLPANGGITTSTANTGTSILGAWATVGGTDWAVSSGDGTNAGGISALTTYQTATTPASWLAADNVSLAATAVTSIPTTTINSLRLTGTATHTVTAGNTLTITTGGILITGAAAPTMSSTSTSAATLRPGVGADWVITNSSSGTATISTGNTLVLANPASGAASNLIKNGSGTVSLTGATTNTFGGAGKAVIINGGILAPAVDAALGNASNIVILNGGRLGFSAGTTSSTNTRSITVNDVPGNGFDYSSTSGTPAIAFGGLISGPGSITLTRSGGGTGTLVIANTANTFGGVGQSVTAATSAYVVATGSADSLGNTANAIAFGNGNLTFGGTAASDTPTVARPISVSAGTGGIGVSAGWTLSLTGALTGSNTLTINPSTTNGSGGTTLVNGSSSTSVVVLNGNASAFTGALTIANGTLRLGSSFVAPATGFGLVSVSPVNGAFDLNGNSITAAGFGSLVATASVTNSSPTAATLTSTAAATFNGVISATGTINVVKSGTSQWTFGASNPYTGSTTVIGGTLSIGTAGQITGSSGVMIGNGGVLQVNNSGGTPFGASPTIPISLGGTGYSGGTITGTLTTAMGPLSVATGISTVSAAASNTLTFASLGRNTGATINFAATGTNIVTGGSNVNGIVGPWATVGAADFAAYSAGSVVALNAAATNAETSWTDPAANILITAAGQTLTAPRSMNTLRNTTASGTLSLGASGTFNLSTNAILNLSGAVLVVSRSGTSTAVVQPTSGSEFTFLGTNSITISAPLVAATVTNSDNQSVTLGFAANTITDVYSNAGTVTASGIASFGASAANSTNTAASANATTLSFADVTGFSVGQSLSGPGLAPGTKITDITGTTVTLSNGLTAGAGSSSLYAVPSAGTIYLNGGAVSFTGTTPSTVVKAVNVSGGGRITPAAATGVTTFDTANITINTNATLTFGNPGNNPSTGTINLNPTSGKLTGPGAVTYGAGNGTILATFYNIYGANDYTGGTTFAQGNSGAGLFRVNFNSSSAFGTGAISLGPGSNSALALESLQALSPNLTIANPIRSLLASTASFFVLGGATTNDFTISGPISLETANLTGFSVAANRTITLSGNITEVGGSRPVTIAGPGALQLSGANTYTGVTTLRSGTLLVAANAPAGLPGALGNASSTVALGDASTTTTDSIALLTNAAITVARDITVGAQNSAGTTTLGGNAAVASSFTGAVTLGRNVTITQAAGGSTTFGGTITGTGFGLTKTGGGTVALAAANTYSGVTAVNAGTVVLAASNALPNGSATTLAGGTLAVTPGTDNGSQTGGTLTISSNSTIDFANAGTPTILRFGNSSGVTWSGLLTINGYTGLGGGVSGSPTTQLFVGLDGTGLTSTQLASITFTGFDPGVTILNTGEVVPVPEPGTAGLAVAGIGLALLRRRRRA